MKDDAISIMTDNPAIKNSLLHVLKTRIPTNTKDDDVFIYAVSAFHGETLA